MRKLFLITALLCGCAQAQTNRYSTYMTGQELYTRMTGSDAQIMMGYGYVAGVADNRAGITICIPPGLVTLGQMSDMVKQNLERIPSERHMPADVYVEATLSHRWPCAKKNGQDL